MLLVLMCWATATLDCAGNPERDTIRYQHQVAYQSIIGTEACGDLPEYGACPVYALTPFNLAMEGADPCALVPVPLPGECAFLLTTAYDEADNADCGI